MPRTHKQCSALQLRKSVSNSISEENLEVNCADRYISSDQVVIEVGPEKVAYNVHRTLFCDASPYFKVAFDGDFKEAQEGKLVLPAEKAEVFDYVVQWM